jgi:hypothetical protein
MKAKLGSSVKAEEKAVKGRYDKFERADAALAEAKTPGASNSSTGGNGKVIRDSFTMPEADYRLIEPLKVRCMKAGIGVNKSELLRAGLQALTQMPDRELANFLGRLERVKPGRPPK